jgi:ATP-dependent Clp protease adapter protein ClpS
MLETRTKTQRPPLYKVLLLNDDYTPMEFVVHVLERFFGMNHAQAFELMLTVHKKGVAVVGVFSFEVAETKVGRSWISPGGTSTHSSARWKRNRAPRARPACPSACPSRSTGRRRDPVRGADRRVWRNGGG